MAKSRWSDSYSRHRGRVFVLAVALIITIIIIIVIFLKEMRPTTPIIQVKDLILQSVTKGELPTSSSSSHVDDMSSHEVVPQTFTSGSGGGGGGGRSGRSSRYVGITVCLYVWVQNPNRGAFHYSGIGASMYYQGAQIGFIPMPGGQIDAKSAKTFIVYLSSGGNIIPNTPSSSSPLTQPQQQQHQVEAVEEEGEGEVANLPSKQQQQVEEEHGQGEDANLPSKQHQQQVVVVEQEGEGDVANLPRKIVFPSSTNNIVTITTKVAITGSVNGLGSFFSHQASLETNCIVNVDASSSPSLISHTCN